MKITADYIFLEGTKLMTDLFIETDKHGKILNIGNAEKEEEIIHYDGLIVPGFFNCHTHLELAGACVDSNNGLEDFLLKIKEFNNQQKDRDNYDDFLKLDVDMYNQGVEFCADISNTDKTIKVKKKSNILYYNFIEIFEKLNEDTIQKFTDALAITERFYSNNLSASTVPHSLYSISPCMISLIGSYNNLNKNISTVHFKESNMEDQLHDFQHRLYRKLAQNHFIYFHEKFNASQDITTILGNMFAIEQKIIFVHNIYMNKKERNYIYKNFRNSALCICPSSNLNTEKNMTDIENLNYFDDRVFIGTDSPASNKEMRYIKELYIMQKNYKYTLEEIIKMSTKNPAEYFDIKHKGKIKAGYCPGLVLISDFNMRDMELTSDSISKRLV